MAYIAPTSELVQFLETRVPDTFPTVYDAGTSVPERYTRVWAEYYNKIRNFIGVVEPLCTSQTAQDVGVNGITLWTLNPAPSINDLLYGYAKKAYTLGKAPPTNVLPFEIVITSSTDVYSNWHKLSTTSQTVPMLYQASSAIINKITMGSFHTLKPMVQCSLKSTNELSLSTRWLVSSYCVNGTDTLLIRGCILDTKYYSPVNSSLPVLSRHFPDGNLHKLHVSILGVR